MPVLLRKLLLVAGAYAVRRKWLNQTWLMPLNMQTKFLNRRVVLWLDNIMMQYAEET